MFMGKACIEIGKVITPKLHYSHILLLSLNAVRQHIKIWTTDHTALSRTKHGSVQLDNDPQKLLRRVLVPTILPAKPWLDNIVNNQCRRTNTDN